jgi:hypothetical protein
VRSKQIRVQAYAYVSDQTGQQLLIGARRALVRLSAVRANQPAMDPWVKRVTKVGMACLKWLITPKFAVVHTGTKGMGSSNGSLNRRRWSALACFVFFDGSKRPNLIQYPNVIWEFSQSLLLGGRRSIGRPLSMGPVAAAENGCMISAFPFGFILDVVGSGDNFDPFI